MTETQNTLETLMAGFASAIRPIALAAARDPVPSGIHALMKDAGLDVDRFFVDPAPVVAVVNAAANAYQGVLPILDAGGLDDPRQLKRLGDALVRVVTAVRQLNGLQLRPDLEEIPASVARQLIDYLLVDYLEREHPVAFRALVLAGAVTPPQPLLRRPGRTHPEVIAQWLRDPEAAFGAVYGWGGADFQAQLFLQRLADLLPFLHIAAYVQGADPRVLGGGDGEADSGAHWQLRIPILTHLTPGNVSSFVQVGLALVPLPAAENQAAGLAVVPFVKGNAGAPVDLGDQWQLALKVFGDASVPYALLARPGQVTARVLTGAELPSSQIGASVAVERRLPANERLPLFSGPGGLKIELGTLGLQVGWSYRDGEAEFQVMLPVKNSLLSVRPPAEDGFLGRVLPPDGLNAAFDVGFGWSSRKGFFFQGSAGLDTALPVRASLGGVLGIDLVHLGVRATEEGIRAHVAADAAVQLGPILALVEQTGLEATLGFPANGGNLGVADLSVAFKPPAGAALAVDAGAVKGGGYLFFNPERGEYAGILQLELGGTVGVKAIGLINTRMPDGSPGFSLFVLIAADGFAPIQLGMGFTLTGIGGMLGLNRTVNTEVLRNADLGTVLFPQNPLRNAPAIISNLSAVFPPAPNRFLFGPMAELAWGTPPLMKAKLALLMEIPDPVRLLLLGRVTLELPDARNAVARIQLDVLGELNFHKGTVSLDGVLVDSKLLEFALTGRMALRASWGSRPFFLLAMGGFNPRFPAPAALPKLDRLAISLSSSKDLRLRLEAYLALTSNTAQFGGRLELYARAGDFSVEGYFGYDVLIQFAPFGFVADIAAGVTLRFKKTVLAGLHLAITVSGPTPWHVRGKATFKLGFIKKSFDVNYRFGRATPPPLPAPVNVRDRLVAALNATSSWSSELPADRPSLVTLRRVEAAGVVAHPLARLTVRQREVPLNREIQRVGNARPAGTTRRFDVTVSAPLQTDITVVREQFARGQFLDLTDNQKLSQPSFEEMDAGYSFGTDRYVVPAALFDTPIDYETTTLDPLFPEPAGSRSREPVPA